jgi:hypothetical protein
VRLGSTFVTTKEWLDTCYELLQQGMQLKALGAKNAKADMEAIQKKQKQKRGRQVSYDQYELSEDEVSSIKWANQTVYLNLYSNIQSYGKLC